MFHYAINEVEGLTQVHFNGDLDIEATELFEERLLPEVNKSREVLINFTNVPFVDSSGIGLLLNLVRFLQASNIAVNISGVTPDVKIIFDLLQIPDIVGEHVFR